MQIAGYFSDLNWSKFDFNPFTLLNQRIQTIWVKCWQKLANFYASTRSCLFKFVSKDKVNNKELIEKVIYKQEKIISCLEDYDKVKLLKKWNDELQITRNFELPQRLSNAMVDEDSPSKPKFKIEIQHKTEGLLPVFLDVSWCAPSAEGGASVVKFLILDTTHLQNGSMKLNLLDAKDEKISLQMDPYENVRLDQNGENKVHLVHNPLGVKMQTIWGASCLRWNIDEKKDSFFKITIDVNTFTFHIFTLMLGQEKIENLKYRCRDCSLLNLLKTVEEETKLSMKEINKFLGLEGIA